MNIKNQMKIQMSLDDIKDAIIKTLYRERGISGLFNVKFNLKHYDALEGFMLDSATVTVDLNNTNEQK
jgi:hypothetical protein